MRIPLLMPPSLFVSELFGHERGAFTGADQRHVGAFGRAAGGTLFLDEVGELSPDAQSALLGVLERRRMRPLGSKTEVAVNARVVCATSRELRRDVNTGPFRLDLYYRLAVVLLEVPPLRERREDIPQLVRRFLAESSSPSTLEQLFPPAEMARLMGHEWRGSVRELRNVVLGTVALGRPVLEDSSGEVSSAALPAIPRRAAHRARRVRAAIPHRPARAYERKRARGGARSGHGPQLPHRAEGQDGESRRR